jgi:transcription-repair coupling factor (superfamily II helicase)
MKLVSIKALCHRAHVEKLEAGPKGVIVGFRDNSFANPKGLVELVAARPFEAKVRPDMKVVFMGDYEDINDRLEGAKRIVRTLVSLAERKKAA